MKIACLILLVILEIPLLIKFIKCGREFEIIRQTAVTILMILTALIVFGIYKLGMLIIG